MRRALRSVTGRHWKEYKMLNYMVFTSSTNVLQYLGTTEGTEDSFGLMKFFDAVVFRFLTVFKCRNFFFLKECFVSEGNVALPPDTECLASLHL